MRNPFDRSNLFTHTLSLSFYCGTFVQTDVYNIKTAASAPYSICKLFCKHITFTVVICRNFLNTHATFQIRTLSTPWELSTNSDCGYFPRGETPTIPPRKNHIFAKIQKMKINVEIHDNKRKTIQIRVLGTVFFCLRQNNSVISTVKYWIEPHFTIP